MCPNEARARFQAPQPGLADSPLTDITKQGGGVRRRLVVPRPGRKGRRRPRSGAAASQQLRPTQRPGSRPGTRESSGSAGGDALDASPAGRLQRGPDPLGEEAALAPQPDPGCGAAEPATPAAAAHASFPLPPLTIFAAAVAGTRRREPARSESAELPPHRSGTEPPGAEATQRASLPGGGHAGARAGPKHRCTRHALPAVAMQRAGLVTPRPGGPRQAWGFFLTFWRLVNQVSLTSSALMKVGVGVGPPSSVTDEEAELGLAPAAEELAKDEPRLVSLPPPHGRGHMALRPFAKALPLHGSSHLARCAQPLGRGLGGGEGREGKSGRSRIGGEAREDPRAPRRGPPRMGCIPHILPTLVRFPPSSPDWPSQALRVLA